MPQTPPTPVMTNASVKKLNQDVTATRTQRLLDADLARTLLHRDQHDVHQADAGNAQRQRSNKRHQHLQTGRDDAELGELLHQVGDKNGVVIGRGKSMRLRRAWPASADSVVS